MKYWKLIQQINRDIIYYIFQLSLVIDQGFFFNFTCSSTRRIQLNLRQYSMNKTLNIQYYIIKKIYIFLKKIFFLDIQRKITYMTRSVRNTSAFDLIIFGRLSASLAHNLQFIASQIQF